MHTGARAKESPAPAPGGGRARSWGSAPRFSQGPRGAACWLRGGWVDGRRDGGKFPGSCTNPLGAWGWVEGWMR